MLQKTLVPRLDKIILSVGVVFNEVIPEPTADYFAELENMEAALEFKDSADF